MGYKRTLDEDVLHSYNYPILLLKTRPGAERFMATNFLKQITKTKPYSK